MTMSKPRIAVPQEQIAEFCRRHRIRKLALFGSVLRDDFGPESDVDVLVEFEPGVPITWEDRERMKSKLREMFGRDVDLVDRSVVERSRNYIRRQHILSSLLPVYVA